MSRKRQGSELKQVVAIRLQPSDKELIKKVFGSVQAWIELCLKCLHDTRETKIPGNEGKR